MFAFVGVGQAGGNIANLASKKGFKSLAINYSQKDLDSLDSVGEKLKLIGTEGVGKRRNDAIVSMPQNIESLQSFLEHNLSSPKIEIIVIVFAAGGGTGSGLSPLLIELISSEFPNACLVACPILPDERESPVSQYNTIKLSEELSPLNIAVLPIDNHKVENATNKSQLFRRVNEEFIDLFDEVLSYTNKESVNGIIDKKDLLEIFKTPGVCMIARTDLAKLAEGKVDISPEGVSKKIKQSWNQSIFATPEYTGIESMGIIFDGQESLMGHISHEKIVEDFECYPPYIYEGYYGESKGKVITLLSGLSWYSSRLNEIENLFENQTSDYKNDSNIYLSKLENGLPEKPKKSEKVGSALDILSKYQNR